MNNEYSYKLDSFIFESLPDLINPKILEFGVREGVSTIKFLNFCKNCGGNLFSVDIDDCSNVSKDKNWNFIQCRDDDFKFLENRIPKELDIILIDSFHNANHVKKILYHYYDKLKVGGLLFIDDICWIPYVKNNYRNHFNSEMNNRETFEMLNEVLFANQKNLNLSFTFIGSGMAKIIKLKDSILNPTKSIHSRKFSFKNLIRKLIRK